MLTTKINYNLEQQKLGDHRILLFDLSVGGHHPGYILHLIQYWHEQKLSGSLDILVLPEFLERHGDVVDVANEYQQSQVRFVPISQEERAKLAPRSHFYSRKKLNFQEWGLLCKYAKLLKTTQALVMYFDTYQLPMLLRRNPPCPVSAIYFRPKFHYQNFLDNPTSWQERWDRKREKLHLALVLRNRNLKTLFCLDPFIIEYLKEFHTSVKTIYLGDPVKSYENYDLKPKKIKNNLGIDTHRQVFLLFGGLDRRKGLFQLLDALFLLPNNISSKISILLMGPITPQIRQEVELQIKRLDGVSSVQIIICNRFIDEREIQPYFQTADVILAPYQDHVGMSAILVRAAVAQKPVISSKYGLMGEITRRYRLGLTVNSQIPSEIAEGITQLLSNSLDQIGDLHKMKIFAEQNNPQKFAQVIFQNLLDRKE